MVKRNALRRLAFVAALGVSVAACQDRDLPQSNRHLQPIPPATLALMSSKGMSPRDPILIRSFKLESELEIWKKGPDGQYALLQTYPICRWSGQLGPKHREGDRQAPEGFYAVTPAHMNPNSSFYLSFDTGFPNAFDRTHGRTGSHLMVHGSCTSRGCFAMTDEAIAEVYAIMREAFAGGQRSVQFQSFPFRMTPQNLARKRYDENIAFWRNLKEGYDNFALTRREPAVEVCGGRYSFNTRNCAPVDPMLAQAVAQRQMRDDSEIARIVAAGEPAVRIVFEDGGGHPSFGIASRAPATFVDERFASLETPRPRRNLGVVSRPEALAAGPRFVPVDSRGRPIEATPAQAPAAYAAVPSQPAAPAPASPQPAASAPVAAASPAPAEPNMVERMFGGLFSGMPFARQNPAATESAPVAPAAAAPVPPPRRGASLLPGAAPLGPDSTIGYSSLR